MRLSLNVPSGAKLTFIFVGNSLNYLDRQAFAVAAPLIAVEMQLAPFQLGLSFSVFYLGYALFVFFGGYFADRFGAKHTVSASVAGWSVFCALTAVPMPFALLLLVRLLFGASESPYAPAASKLVRRWFPLRDYGGAWGIANVGQPIGGLIAGPIIAALSLAIGWRAAFVGIAGIGFVWVVLWVFCVKEGQSVADAPSAHRGCDINNDSRRPRLLPLLGELVRMPALVAVCITYFCFAYLLYFFLNWFPSFLVVSKQISVGSMGLLTMIPWGSGAIGLVAGGFASNLVLRRDSPVRGFKTVVASGLCLAAFCAIPAGSVSSGSAAVGLMAVSSFALYFTAVSYFAILQVLVPEHIRGSAAGFCLLGASVGGVVSPFITGILVQSTGHFFSAFATAGVVSLIGAAVMITVVRESQARGHARMT